MAASLFGVVLTLPFLILGGFTFYTVLAKLGSGGEDL